MATSTATGGFGVLLKAGDGGGTEVFTTIAEVKSISGVGFNVNFADITHMESPSAIREFLPTLIEPGEISLTLNFLPDNATHDAIRIDLLARTKRNFKLNFTDNTPAIWSFSGYYSSVQVNSSVDGVLEATVSIKQTGSVVET